MRRAVFVYDTPYMFMEQDETIETAYLSRAHLLNRFLAKFIDFLVVAAVYEIPLQISFLAGMAYLSIADGFNRGSLGKRMIGLTTRVREGHGLSASFRESIVRNIPFAVAYLLYPLPYVGWLMALGIVGFEAVLIMGNPRGIRLGDELAKTFVWDPRARVTPVASEPMPDGADKQ